MTANAPTKNYKAIPDPTTDPNSLRESVLALKETVEILVRHRRPATAGAVTWQDLVDLQLITEDQVPRR